VIYFYDSLDERQTQKLFEKYSEDAIVAFADHFHKAKETESSDEYIHRVREREDRLFLTWEVELPSSSATVRSPDLVNVEPARDYAMDRRISEDEMILWDIIEKIAKRIELNPNAFFSREREAGRQGSVAESSQFIDFVKLATKTASTPEDFSNIRTITTVRNRILSYRRVGSFIEELVSQTLTRRSVVSFYVNTDVWRLFPLVMENKNWLSLSEDFLKSKHQQKSQR
jgi:hypothetical protein